MTRRSTVLVLLAAAGIAAAAWGYRFLTAHSFSAREKPTAIEAFLARKARYHVSAGFEAVADEPTPFGDLPPFSSHRMRSWTPEGWLDPLHPSYAAAGLSVGQIVGEMNQVKPSTRVVLEMIEELIDAVARLNDLMT